jgi:hypothetical protein
MYSPRIYLYKITFEEVPYYYYGVKKEKYFNQEYWGTPITHKWCWELYTPKKQILEIFPYTDDGWIEAQKIEGRLIKPFFNTDKWCLNENCGGKISLDIRRKTGGVCGKKMYKEKKGIHSQTREERCEFGKKLGEWNKENTTKEFSVISPEGVIMNEKNVREFCKRENLNRRNFIHLLNGNWKQYKGWKLAF